MSTTRIALAGAVLACALTPAALVAAPVAATIRVEGGSATVIPQTPASVDDAAGATVTLRDARDPDTIAVSARSATAQLAGATARFAVPVSFDIFNFGGPSSFITRIGPDQAPPPPAFAPFWRFTVNHVTGNTGADATSLASGDSIVWAFVDDFGARELDIALSTDRAAAGSSVVATVQSFAPADGSAVPAVGALVTYGEASALADANGQLRFATTGEGARIVRATRAGEVRSPARSLCSFTSNPTVCDLPALPPPSPAAPPAAGAAGAPGASGAAGTPGAPGAPGSPGAAGISASADSTAPGSRILFPRAGRVYVVVRALRGQAGPDRSDLAGVEVAVAQRVGTLCRFRTASGRYLAPRSCARRGYLRTRSAGGDWILALGRRPLAPGLYRAWSRASDGAGNRESVGIPSVNTFQFSVVRPAVVG